MRPRILTLTTDFGLDGHYVAAMKGVVLGRVPDVQFVDVTHSVGPQNVLEGAFVLSNIVDTFPEGTVHLAVVDPGVGTARRLVAARLAGQWFVAPDNGLLTYVARKCATEEVFEIENPEFVRPNASNTFHGRDILAPAAAHLLDEGRADELGPKRHGVTTLPAVEPRRDDRGVLGEVIFRDRFGNLITNVPAPMLEDAPAEAWEVEVAGSRIEGLSLSYGHHPPGTLVSLVGSSGWLEVSLVNGDASRHLDAGPGATVWFRRRD